MDIQKTLPFQKSEIIHHSRMLNDCFHHWTGQAIFDLKDPVKLSEAMYYAPFVVVSHGTESDPVFNYANLKAQELWQFNWDEFIKLPSRKSAEPMEEIKRNVLLEEGRKKGVTFLEKGIRVNREGVKFYIMDVILFNLFSEDSPYLGQGAVYNKWEFF